MSRLKEILEKLSNAHGISGYENNVSQMIEDVKATIHAVFTVLEEVGLKGGRTSAFGLDPDVALVSEVTFAGDHPGIEKKDSSLG